jgi:hypothetical protein
MLAEQIDPRRRTFDRRRGAPNTAPNSSAMRGSASNIPRPATAVLITNIYKAAP